MGLQVRPFDPAHDLEHAASLLAERHARDRARDPRFPAAYDVPAACRPHIEQVAHAEGAVGFVAVDAGEVVGFAVMQPFLANPTHMTAAFFTPRTINIGYASHAAAAGREYDIYRELYGALAEQAVARGFFDHNVYLAPRDQAAVEAFVSLGFGRTVVAGLRGVDPVDSDAAGVEMHLASSEDAAVVFALNDELNLHHARAPIFWPLLPETAESSHQFTRDLLAEAEKNAHWIAYKDGQPLGMNTFMPPVWVPSMVTPDDTIYLYQGVVSEQARSGGVGRAILSHGVNWAREQGFHHIALHYASPNISGARFWSGNGFEPVEYRLTRHIDERIAWAGAR